jgi:2-polyprenyl-6-hydroxyphenyl methylase/3-demethylubiquinone-9 3-methyltransferase
MSREAHSSVDPKEVAYYSALAERWWDRSGPFWPLHVLNEVRVQYITEMLCETFQRDVNAPRPLAELRILDIGCGGGILSEAVARLGGRVHGIDVVERNVAVARLHAEQMGLEVRYETRSAEALVQTGAQYDVVLNMEVVEHVVDLPGFLHTCNNLVRAGGIEFIATINRTLLSWLVAIVGAEYLLRWLPRGTHQWRRFRKPGELKALLSTNGMRVVAETGVRVNPVTRTMSLTRFMGVNYMLVAERPGQPHAA